MVKDHSDIQMDVFVYIKTVGKTAGHHGSCFGEVKSPVGKVGFSPNTNIMMGLVKMSQNLWLRREIIVVWGHLLDGIYIIKFSFFKLKYKL